MTKKKTVKKSEIWVKFFTIGCVFYSFGDWDDLQIDLHVSLHGSFKIQSAGIVPVFLEFNSQKTLARNMVAFELAIRQISFASHICCEQKAHSFLSTN